jgi:hypothetical protein
LYSQTLPRPREAINQGINVRAGHSLGSGTADTAEAIRSGSTGRAELAHGLHLLHAGAFGIFLRS